MCGCDSDGDRLDGMKSWPADWEERGGREGGWGGGRRVNEKGGPLWGEVGERAEGGIEEWWE